VVSPIPYGYQSSDGGFRQAIRVVKMANGNMADGKCARLRRTSARKPVGTNQKRQKDRRSPKASQFGCCIAHSGIFVASNPARVEENPHPGPLPSDGRGD